MSPEKGTKLTRLVDKATLSAAPEQSSSTGITITPPWLIAAMTIAAAGTLMGPTVLAPLLSNALDHPIDQSVLGIPSPVPDFRFFVAGGLSAATSHGITTPVDVVKTRMQSDAGLQKLGLAGAAADLLRQEGPAVLLEGLGPTVVGYGVEGALKFGLYESMKPAFAGWLHSATADLSLPYLLASVTAGAAASVILCPMEQLRIRAVTDPTFQGLPDLVAEGGLVGLFRGLPAMLSKQVPYTYGKQVTYDEFASFLYSAGDSVLGLPEAAIRVEVSVVAAFLASMVACLLSHPGDVVLTSTYKKKKKEEAADRDRDGAASLAAPQPRDFLATVRSIYAAHGVGGFVAGITARLVHVGVIVTSQLVLYDSVKQVLGLPATGAH
jgi:solute carrier family 25 (mitochondrial phosphate transporter), member 3